MQLEIYISDLLYRYDCVTVPNFGAFLSHRVSAKWHEPTHTFYPPKKILSFNAQIQHNDGLLANYIAEVENISYSKATELIAKSVKAIKFHLAQKEKVSFKDLGEFTLNKEEKTVFSPLFHVNYLIDAYGLSPFTLTNVTREVPKVIESTTATVTTLKVENKSRKHWLKYAASISLLIGLLGFGIPYYNTVNVRQHNQHAQQKANALLNTEIQEATFVIENPLPAVILSFKSQSGNYHIVAGAFAVEANANAKVKQLKAQGFDYARKINKNKKGLHLVIYGSFSSRRVAVRELKLIQRDNASDAWLLVKQL